MHMARKNGQPVNVPQAKSRLRDVGARERPRAPTPDDFLLAFLAGWLAGRGDPLAGPAARTLLTTCVGLRADARDRLREFAAAR